MIRSTFRSRNTGEHLQVEPLKGGKRQIHEISRYIKEAFRVQSTESDIGKEVRFFDWGIGYDVFCSIGNVFWLRT